MQLPALLALTGVTLAIATPVAPPQPHALPPLRPFKPLRTRQDENSTAPCAQVSAAVYQSDVSTSIPAQLAYDCLNTIPLNATSAKQLLKAMPIYINWQSTLTTLKNPPEEYRQKVQPPIDILGGLDLIAADIDAGKYSSEYEFGWSLYTLIQSAHDGHFAYVPDSVGNLFNFGRPVPLVSVSEDGKKLPSVFAFHDVLGMQFKNISYTPSPVVQIEGQDVTKYLEKLSQYGSLQDRDALYNNVFYELAQVSLGSSGSGTGIFTGGGRGRWVYPGATTTLTFANGTTYTMQNYARVLVPFRDITSGQDLADRYFTYGFADTADVMTKEDDTPDTPTAPEAAVPGYPTPVVAGPANLINGFFIDAPGYEDVAVLQVPNFVGDTSYERRFQETTRQFIPQAVAAGKTKLIIDVQANGGGTILQGYDMFKQLFPSLDPYGASRFRAIEAVDLIGQSFSNYASQVPRQSRVNSTVKSIQSSYFDYHSDMTVDGKPWASWDDKFGPVEANGDKYTSLSRWNLSDIHISYNSGGINITGYGSLANASTTQPFKAENIVILTDGYCASTCTIFSEFLTKQAGVKTIALGGRSNKNQIQAIGGVKGVNNYQWPYIQSLAQQAISLSPELNTSALAAYKSNLYFSRAATYPGVNVRDGVLLNDQSGVALQFIYEEADCRLYYTPEMTVDATAIWKAAAAAQWGASGKCVGGSGYGKRDVTTRLSPRRVKLSQAAALAKFEAFENTFNIETASKWVGTGDGFMSP